jgi:hypothetical protein
MQYRVGRAIAASVLLSVSIFSLTACGDGGSAALAARDHAAPGEFASASEASNGGSEARLTSAPIRLSRAQSEGSDIAWASSRRASGAENAQARFERYGAEFDAPTPEAYAAKARAFLRSPPKGVQTIQRANGDVLIYDAKANVFAVADSDGLPRTFFHPRDGATYWAQQKVTESKRTASASRSNASDS